MRNMYNEGPCNIFLMFKPTTCKGININNFVKFVYYPTYPRIFFPPLLELDTCKKYWTSKELVWWYYTDIV